MEMQSETSGEQSACKFQGECLVSPRLVSAMKVSQNDNDNDNDNDTHIQ